MHSLVLQRARRALPVTLLAFAACGDDGGPRLASELPVSASVMRAKAAQIAEVSQQAPILAISSGFLGFPVRATGAVGGGAIRGARDIAMPIRLPVRRNHEVGGEFFPTDALGKTFVRNAVGEWVVDTLASGAPRPGAPTLGIRFVLQATDYFGNVSGPPVGLLDLTPRITSSSSIGYRGVARTMDGTVVLRWDSDQTLMGESGSIAGQALSGTRVIDMSESGTLTGLTSNASAAFAGVSRTSTFKIDPSDIEGDFTATTTVKVDGGTVRIVNEQKGDEGIWRIYSNGGLFARMDFPASDSPFVPDPVWMQGDGKTPLDAEDMDAIYALYEMTNALPMLFIIDISVQFWLFELSSFGTGMP